MATVEPGRSVWLMFVTLGVGIALLLGTALAVEQSTPELHNVHLAAVGAAVGWVLYFAARGHR